MPILLPQWLKDLRLILKGTDRWDVKKKIKKRSDELTDGPYSLEAIFTGWVYHMLKEGSFFGNELTFGSIRDYTSQICRRVAGLTGDEDSSEKMSWHSQGTIWAQAIF